MKFDYEANCYEAAGRLISTRGKGAKLVNGTVFSQKLGKMIDHAWVEDGGKVFDFAGGRRVVMKREDYYVYGRAVAIQTYTREEALRMLRSTRRFTFWSKEQRKKILG